MGTDSQHLQRAGIYSVWLVNFFEPAVAVKEVCFSIIELIEVLRPGNMVYKIYFTFLQDILINTQFLSISYFFEELLRQYYCLTMFSDFSITS